MPRNSNKVAVMNQRSRSRRRVLHLVILIVSLGLCFLDDIYLTVLGLFLQLSPDISVMKNPENTTTGVLWTADAMGGDPHAFQRVTIVVSHCLKPLDWLEDFTKGFAVDNVTIISKCDKEVIGTPPSSTIIRLPNVGRCDHSYAHFIKDFVRTEEEEGKNDDSHVVVFLKDDRSDESIHQAGLWRSFEEMLRITSRTGFACGMKPTEYNRNWLSAFHEASVLKNFHLYTYEGIRGKYDSIVDRDVVPFKSPHANLGAWMRALHIQLPKHLLQVCYGGTFAVAANQIRAQPEKLWSSLEDSLSRGNNIEEGHFAERVWAALLSKPINKGQIASLRSFSQGVLRVPGYIRGALFRHR